MSGFENDIVFALNADFTESDNQSPSEANGLATDGQMWIGTTAVNAGGTHINVGALTSPDSSLIIGYSSPNITLEVTGGSTVGQTITGNSGGALSPTLGNWNILTDNTTVTFAGAGSTLTEDFGLTNLILGSSAISISSGTLNVGLGLGALNAVTTGAANVAIGNSSLNLLTTSASNTCVGYLTGSKITTSASTGGNVLIGAGAGSNMTSGSNTYIGRNCGLGSTTGTTNTCIGDGCLDGALTSQRVIAIGNGAASAYTGAESSNIIIGNSGVTGDNNRIRIGTQGSGSGQQDECYIAGIASVATSNSEMVTIDTTTGQLGSTTIPTGTVTSVSGTADRITSTGGATPVIDIAGTYVGQTSITTLGTIATGVWNGTTIDETHGGTNQTTYVTGDILYASGANTLSKLSAGSNDDVLTLSGGVPTWAAPAAPSGAIYASGTLTNAQFKALNTSPLTIAAAPGAGSHYVVVSAGFALNYGGTNAFTSGGSLQFQVNGTSVVSFASTGYTGTVSSQSFGSPSNVTAGSFDNGVLRLIAGSSDPGGNAANDNTVDWYCLYVLA